MKITADQREAWLEKTAESPFNQWLQSQTKGPDGSLDLEKLYRVALNFGIDKRNEYAHLNSGQQRMNIGNLLRKVVPRELYDHDAEAKPNAPRMVMPNKSPRREEPSPPPVARLELIAGASTQQLLRMYGQIMDELTERKIVRTANGPGGDYAELLFSRAFDWSLASNSAAGFDAVDKSGVRYQIKSRRIARSNSSRQLSALRRLPEAHFDYLAGVLFTGDYTVWKAALIPHAFLMEEGRCRYSDHTKAWIFTLNESVWSLPGVKDVTAELIAAQAF